MSLRDPKEVADEAYKNCGSWESVRDDFDEIEHIIRADRAAVIAEAKRAVGAKAYPKTSGHGQSSLYVSLADAFAALDDILKET